MHDSIIIDTDILIDAGRGLGDAVSCLDGIERQAGLAVSIVSIMELTIGCRNKTELRTLERFVRRFQIVMLNEQISGTALDLLRRYRLSHGLLIPDALIAATALSLEMSLVSKNQRDYRFIEPLSLCPYPQPFPLI